MTAITCERCPEPATHWPTLWTKAKAWRIIPKRWRGVVNGAGYCRPHAEAQGERGRADRAALMAALRASFEREIGRPLDALPLATAPEPNGQAAETVCLQPGCVHPATHGVHVPLRRAPVFTVRRIPASAEDRAGYCRADADAEAHRWSRRWAAMRVNLRDDFEREIHAALRFLPLATAYTGRPHRPSELQRGRRVVA